MNVIVDSCFWYAFYDGSDYWHQEAVGMMELLTNHRILIPFPSLYETINTRFCRRKEWTTHFNHILTSPHNALIHDNRYKDATLQLTIEASSRGRTISMVDMVIRQMLGDINLRVDAIITFNPEDFADVCRKRIIQLISSSETANILAPGQ